ncbi:aldolase/citrate lyase family protein [Streptomyces halstedii]|uniref:aldolase/citrate lyase family protein n=1 Tax=Streptomyces halstedii TaxID=1944 RepID=UPI0038651BC4|nr:aldolase/citrate lyase family protein [Streptomyces halstedii]
MTVVTLDFPDADTAEFIGRLGCDGIAVDLEHSDPTAGELSGLARACAVAGVPLIGRIRCQERSVARCLDAGITILQLTQVTGPADVDRVTDWAAFPPDGHRGIGRARANAFGHHPGGYPAFVESVRSDGIALLIHIETVEAVTAASEIASRPWVKALVVGAHDLAASAGHPGDPSHPDVRRLVEQATACVAGGDKLLGLSVSSRDEAVQATHRGAGLLLLSQARLLSRALASVLTGTTEGTR